MAEKGADMYATFNLIIPARLKAQPTLPARSNGLRCCSLSSLQFALCGYCTKFDTYLGGLLATIPLKEGLLLLRVKGEF